jgi:hypothetical protein
MCNLDIIGFKVVSATVAGAVWGSLACEQVEKDNQIMAAA